MRRHRALAALLAAACGCNLLTHLPVERPIPTAATAGSVSLAATAIPTATASRAASPTAAPTTPAPTATPTAPAPQTSVTRTTHEETRGAVTLQATTVTVRYIIGGLSGEAIDTQMRTLGPTDALGGYHWYALTEPLFDWQLQPSCGDAGCTVQAATLLLTVRYTLPQWSPEGTPDPELAARWAAFEASLIAHEQGHGALATDCAWQLGAAFTALVAPSEAALHEAARAASEPVFAACRAAQRAYEDETDHGRAQGVIWP